MIEDTYAIGYYITFIEHETIDEEYEETRCTNKECKNHIIEQAAGVNFCPECGSKVDWVEFIESKPKTVQSYINDCNENHTYRNTTYFDDVFHEPEFLGKCLGDNYKKVNIEPNEKVIIVNLAIDYNGDVHACESVPEMKEFLGRLKQYKLHYGLVEYSI